MAMTLDQQINYFEVQRTNLVKQILTENAPKLKKQLEATALFFRDVINSLVELRKKQDAENSMMLSLGELFDACNITEISKEHFLQTAEDIINKKSVDMPKADAIKAMQEGKKVAHHLFSDGEYIYMQDNKIYSEDGVCHEGGNDFWKERSLPLWEVGWSIYKPKI